MTKKEKDFIKDNYTFFCDVVSEYGNIPITVYRANCIGDLPQKLIEHIQSNASGYGGVRKASNNADYGIFDARYMSFVSYRGDIPSKVAVYVSAILRRPFTPSQQKNYDALWNKPLLYGIYDSLNENEASQQQ